MPSIITHDSFGQELYKERYTFIGETRDEYEAFLLGNQGPDPLFYSFLSPHLRKHLRLGNTMHQEKPNELLACFKQSLSILESEEEQAVGRAYLLGFTGHYLLDSITHPLVFFNQYQLCDAGIKGLSNKDGNEVHALIESELDEMVLFTKRGTTVAQFNPSQEILKGSDAVLTTISKMYAYTAMTVYARFIPTNMYALALKSFRRTEALFHSKSGIKRELLGRVEELFRSYSFYRSMSHRAIEIEESSFGNHERNPWKNPYTSETSTKSFWDLYQEALEATSQAFASIDHESFDVSAARMITNDLDFSGMPTTVVLTVKDDEVF